MHQVFVRDFPGGRVAKNLPANAGGMGSIPTPERFHMPQGSLASVLQLLSLHAATTKARVPKACVPQQERPPQREALAAQ